MAKIRHIHSANKNIQIGEKYDAKDKEIQTEKEDTCLCEQKCETSKIKIEEDKVICILKRATCSEDEWLEYEEKVESEIELAELLEDLGKVIEAADRVSKKG